MEQNRKYEWTGFAIPIILIIAYIFEMIQIVHKKDAGELSWGFMGSLCVIGILWIFYGIQNKIRPNIIQGIIVLILNLMLIGMKIYYEQKNKNKDK